MIIVAAGLTHIVISAKTLPISTKLYRFSTYVCMYTLADSQAHTSKTTREGARAGVIEIFSRSDNEQQKKSEADDRYTQERSD